MKNILLIIALLTRQLVFAQTPQEQFNKAKELFDNSKNKECIAALQSIEKQIGANPKIYSLYINAYVADKDYTNAAISLNRFRKLVGDKHTEAIQSVLDLEKEINSGVETEEKSYKVIVSQKRMEEADNIVAAARKHNEEKKAVLLKEKKAKEANIPINAALRVAKDKSGTYGYIDENGILVIEPKYDMAYPFKNGKALVSLSGKWIYIDKMGNLIEKLRYSDVFQVSDKLLGFKENGSYGFMDASGQVIHKAQFSNVATTEFQQDKGFVKKEFVVITSQNKHGIMDFEGKIIATPQYDIINAFSEERAVVKSNGLHGCVDKSGKIIVPVKYKYMGEKYRDGLLKYSDGGASGGFLDVNGNIVFEHKYHGFNDFSDGLVKVSNASYGSIGYLDKTGKLVVPMKFQQGEDFSEGLALVYKKNGEKVYIDKTGKEIFKIKTKFLYNSGKKFSDGLAKVQVSDYGYSFIDKTGTTVLTTNSYQFVDDFYDGLACVGNNNAYGFIDKTGRAVTPLQYMYSSKFKNGEAIVFISGYYVYIDKTGKILRKAY
ncbi:MAG: WG repeat-containing protein [Chitinophagaceae bacterium]